MADYKKLMQIANDMREMSYAPYSNFCVGAALLCKDGKIYTGCNIENAAYTPTNCAERTAFFKAVSEGEREFDCIAIVGGKRGEVSPFCAPCGVCRQVMSEWCGKDFKLILGTPEEFKVFSFEEVIPYAFTPSDL